MKTNEQIPTICPRCGFKDTIKQSARERANKTKIVKYMCMNPTCGFKFTQQTVKLLTKGKKHQTGRTSVDLDKAREAKKPGKRIVKHDDGTTSVYYEFRRNRSDIDPAKRL